MTKSEVKKQLTERLEAMLGVLDKLPEGTEIVYAQVAGGYIGGRSYVMLRGPHETFAAEAAKNGLVVEEDVCSDGERVRERCTVGNVELTWYRWIEHVEGGPDHGN